MDKRRFSSRLSFQVHLHEKVGGGGGGDSRLLKLIMRIASLVIKTKIRQENRDNIRVCLREREIVSVFVCMERESVLMCGYVCVCVRVIVIVIVCAETVCMCVWRECACECVCVRVSFRVIVCVETECVCL